MRRNQHRNLEHMGKLSLTGSKLVDHLGRNHILYLTLVLHIQVANIKPSSSNRLRTNRNHTGCEEEFCIAHYLNQPTSRQTIT